MAANHKLGACSTRVLAADTNPQEAPRTSLKLPAQVAESSSHDPPKISYGGEKFLTFSSENRHANRPTQRQFKRV